MIGFPPLERGSDNSRVVNYRPMRTPELQRRIANALGIINESLPAARRKKRDLTQAQFEARARKMGCKPQGFLGYWLLPNGSTAVSVLNAGKRRRDWLRYLARQVKRHAVNSD